RIACRWAMPSTAATRTSTPPRTRIAPKAVRESMPRPTTGRRAPIRARPVAGARTRSSLARTRTYDHRMTAAEPPGTPEPDLPTTRGSALPDLHTTAGRIADLARRIDEA